MSNKKKEFFLVRWFKRCFLPGIALSFPTEEEEQHPDPGARDGERISSIARWR